MSKSTTKHHNCTDCPFENQDCIYCKVCDCRDDYKTDADENY